MPPPSPSISTPLRSLLHSRPNRLLPHILHRSSPRNVSFTRPHSTTTTSSADPHEISHFTSLASTWWDSNGSSRILHLMNPLRIQFIKHCLASSSSSSSTGGVKAAGGGGGGGGGFRYLDVGCGGGILSESLARLPSTKSVLGIDPAPAVLEIARQHLRQDPALAKGGRLRYLNTTIDDLHTGEGGFDVITAMEVMEHVPSPREFLHACLERVEPGGWLIGSTIARHPVAYLTTKILAEGILRAVPWGTHEWARYVDVEEIRRWLGEMEGRRVAGGSEVWRSDGEVRVMGCVYVPGWGWKKVTGGERVGNYFFGVRRAPAAQVGGEEEEE
ncbi:S-adenosyl-L-methionine-dependent methyltransferase, partial [Terfezia claveryi]